MKSIISAASLFLFLISCIIDVEAQESPLKLSSKRNEDKSVDIKYEKDDPCNYTVVIHFKSLGNTSSASEEEVTNAKGYSGTLFTLEPVNKDQSVEYSYSYSYIKGKLNPKYNSDFVYLIPYKKDTKVKVTEAGFVGARYFGDTTPEDWKVYNFYTNKEETVTAVRKGTVMEIIDQHVSDTTSSIAFTSKLNEVIIEHADGTLATYKGFKKGSISVKVGQTIYPGTALGVNTKRSSAKFLISLSLIYLKSADIESTRNRTLKNSKSLYGFVTPHFYVSGQNNIILAEKQEYVSADTPEIIKQELTKKEVKQLIK